ncbi:extracellular mutant protein 11-domain-containing protein [Lasiosphaeris hirsuta]|uniref:Extracellular mutant protein 11-domain-containing protein n=1 Tax=Lasiosphaeris hirsuta TaxID=260670 RepID=A0AA40AFE5_9PEZI|nr:extracellular mutant protein 11-domain-containing protein [Lasiosphaeris hirsuta]
MQRTRTSASEPARELPRGTQNAWEDSTVGSMFGDTDSRAASDRLRGHPALQGAAHGRHYSDIAYQRAQQAQPQPVRNNHLIQQQQQQPTHDENLPFVIGENGLLKVIRQPGAQNRPSVADLNMNMNNGVSNGDMLHDQAATVKIEDVYQDEHQAYDTTPTKLNALRRTKLPHRDARGARRDSFSDRAGGYSSDAQSLGMSPERPGEVVNQIEKVRLEERLQERARRERERERDREQERERDRERERELHHKRSTVFENLTPVLVDEPTFNNTRAAVMIPSTEGSPRASSEEAKEALQLTPRATRKQPQQLQQQFVSQTAMPGGLNLINEGPLGRTGSRRLKEAALPTVAGTSKESKESQSQRKRRHSLDYNDAELHAMSYADLRAQNFDYDPQVVALQQQQQAVQAAPAAAVGTLENRLVYFKGKIGQDQHEFFTRLPVNEWEDAGDWFLEEFSGVVKRMKAARRAKRALIERFEGEISAREEAVRGKVEGIARTLDDLKHEGMTMMAGKEADLEG